MPSTSEKKNSSSNYSLARNETSLDISFLNENFFMLLKLVKCWYMLKYLPTICLHQRMRKLVKPHSLDLTGDLLELLWMCCKERSKRNNNNSRGLYMTSLLLKGHSEWMLCMLWVCCVMLGTVVNGASRGFLQIHFAVGSTFRQRFWFQQ